MKFKLFGLVPFLCLIMSCSLTAQVKPETQTPTQTTTQNKTESSSAQNTMPQIDPNAPYAKDKHSPAFSISSVEGKELTEKDIPAKYKYTCFIIFSPDCSHCEHEAAELKKEAAKFNNVFFVWDSYREMDLIKKFASTYDLIGKANVIIGRDPTYTIPSFFRPKMTPFVALYKNGEFVRIEPFSS